MHPFARRLLMLLAGLLLLPGCGLLGTQPEQAATSSGGGNAAGFPVTVENCGRTLTFDAPPSRVVTSFQPTLETLIELGVADRVIGRTRSLDHLGQAGFLPGHRQIVESIPEVSDSTRPPAKEDLLALGPDLVFGMSYADFNAARGLATVEELNQMGIPVFVPSNWCSPESVERFEVTSTFEDIRNLGKIFGVPDRGEEVASTLEARLRDVEERVGGLEPLRVMAPDASEEVFYVLGQGMGNDLIQRAGGINVFADGGEYDEVSVEEVAARDAQAYMIIDYTPATPAERIAVIERVAPNSEGARQKRYAVVPSVGIHPGVRVVSSIETLARVLHPDAFD